ncbi:MAG: hypothetical protein ACPGGK_00445 [Pikeienuella sp.]
MPRAPDPALRDFIAQELAAPVLPEVAAFAADLAARPGVAAVLFYGSCLQRTTTEGMLDFYVLTDMTDGPQPYGQNAISALAGRALPPNVYPEDFGDLRAKAAIVTVSGFRARMVPTRIDTTFWARFCQRAALVWVRDDAARNAAIDAVAAAVESGAIWAARLSPGSEGTAAWRGLFAHTYKVEIRVEGPGRAADIVGADEDRFAALWPLTATARATAPAKRPGAWILRRVMGKILHISRLLKAAFTFAGGPSYLIWKIRRHRGKQR